MLLTTHILTAGALSSIISKKSRLLLICSVVFSVVPDIDMWLVNDFRDHHQTLSHAPMFWILITLNIYAISSVLRISQGKIISGGMAIGTLSHMILDTFGMALGIAWLAPFSWREYSFLPLNTLVVEANWMQNYLTSSTFKVDLFFATFSALYLVRSYLNRKPSSH